MDELHDAVGDLGRGAIALVGWLAPFFMLQSDEKRLLAAAWLVAWPVAVFLFARYA